MRGLSRPNERSVAMVPMSIENGDGGETPRDPWAPIVEDLKADREPDGRMLLGLLIDPFIPDPPLPVRAYLAGVFRTLKSYSRP